ncbi:uncharacterized protein LOC102801122 [Saccoglossus kowalevskii]|uniref:Cell number regulator 11-like n=1 Tax=Saccoglossus kowalevskii TaxID=10224 RepID=A0ABM0MCP6_SACKO|nr:PREDICTED: cell number regulator 11-like [Saccoglossus kowalevskii]
MPVVVDNDTPQWKNGLFGCFGDVGLCIFTFFLPCWTAGRNAEGVGKSCLIHSLLCLVPVLGWVCQSGVRREIREQRTIAGTCCNDYLVHIFCGCCALIQENQELQTPDDVAVVVAQPGKNVDRD